MVVEAKEDANGSPKRMALLVVPSNGGGRANQAVERTTTAVASTLSEAPAQSLSGISSDARKVLATEQLH